MGYLNEDGLATLVGKVKGQVVQLTQAEYMQIPDSEKNYNNKLYFVEDEEFSWKIDDEPTLNSDGLAKSGGIYAYTSKIGSGTLTTTAQTIIPAINEVNAGLTTITGNINSLRSFTVSIGYVANESLVDTLKRAISGGHIPFGVPFVACIVAGSYRFYAGFFYYSNNKTTGSCFASSFNSAAALLAMEDVWTIKAL